MDGIKISADLANEILADLERYERQIDGQWGSCRDIEELKKSGCMPSSYYELEKCLNENKD